MISEEKKQQLLDKIDIVCEIGKSITLKKTGKYYSARCPFHEDRTPSFFVDQVKKYFKCYGCGVGGDVITFTMQQQNMSYPKAMNYLAQKAGINLYKERKKETILQKKKIDAYQLNDFVRKEFCEALLEKDDNAKRAREYLRSRGIDDVTANFFRIGYAPSDKQWLAHKLRRQNTPIDMAVNLGLLYHNNTAAFYDRLIFPINNKQGKVVGFAARTIGCDGQNKYVNSSTSGIFQKSHHLYGLYENLSAIREENKAIIVEGYLDVLTLHQAGIRNVAALCGTALSEHHVNELLSLVRSCVLCLDPDKSGRRSAQRAIPKLFSKGLFVKVATLPDGEDPASFINQHETESFLRIIQQSQSPIDFIYDQLALTTDDVDDPEWSESTTKILCELVSHLPSKSQLAADRYLSQIAKNTGFSKDLVTFTFEKTKQQNSKIVTKRNSHKVKKSSPQEDTSEIESIIAIQNLFLAWRKVKYFAQNYDIYFDYKLFEQFDKRTDEYLFILQSQLKKQIEEGTPYHPKPFRHLRLQKPKGGFRDIAIPSRIEDRIVIQSILNVIAPNIEKTFSPNSFGHRLSANFADSELTFEHWPNLYGKYQAKLRQFLLAPSSSYYLKADISTFYDRVERQRLSDKVSKYIQNDWTIGTVEKFINFHLLHDDSTTAESELNGLPQGPAYGHFLANLYLADFDRFVEYDFPQILGFKHQGYSRYVDDIFILFPSLEEAKRGQMLLSEELSRLGLGFSKEKTNIHPVKDRQPIIDEMKKKKYTLGKLLDNDENLTVQQREILYSAIDEDFLKIQSASDMAKVADNIPFLVSKLIDTVYFKENQDDLINLIIELLFSESFKHSSIGGVLKKTLPQIVKTRWAKSFAKHLQAPTTPDFKRVLFLQSVEENDFYSSLDKELQECIWELLKSTTDFVRFATANCLWANNATLHPKEVRERVKQEKNPQIQARLLHLADKKCTERTLFPAFLERQARQEGELGYHALLVAQLSLPEASRKVINGCCINVPSVNPALVELLYIILRDGSREAVEQLGKLYDNRELRQIVFELLQIILSHVYQLYEDGYIDECSVLELSKNLSYLKNERIKNTISQGLVIPLVARINKETTNSELIEEFREFENIYTQQSDIAGYIIRAKHRNAEAVDVGFLNERGVSYQAYCYPESECLDLFETIEERYVIENGKFKNIYDWLDFIKDASDNELVWYTDTQVFQDKFGDSRALIHYHLDSTHVRICDLLSKRHVGELELTSFMKNIAEISRQLGSQAHRSPTISPYNIIVDACLKPLFINLGTSFCKPRYISTSLACHREDSPSHDSLFLGWLSFEMLTQTCPLSEIKKLPLADGSKKYLTSSPKLETASIFYFRLLKKLTYEYEDYRRPLHETSNCQLIDDYMKDVHELQKYENQGILAEKIMRHSLLVFWHHRISDVWNDPGLSNQGTTTRMIQSYYRLMIETNICQEVKEISFMPFFEIDEFLQNGMHAGSAFLDRMLDWVECQQNQVKNNLSSNTDRRINLLLMYLTLRVELIAYVLVVRKKFFSNWAKKQIAQEFINANDKTKFLIKHLAIATNTEIKVRWWKKEIDFLSADMIVMLDNETQYECFTKTGLSGLYAFACICTNKNEQRQPIQDGIKMISEWEKNVIACFKNKNKLSDSDYKEYKNHYQNIIKNLLGLSCKRVRAKFEDNLMHWATKTVKIVLDEDDKELEIKIDNMVCVTNDVYEKQRVKGEIATCDLIDGKVVSLSTIGYYENKLCQKSQEKQPEHKIKQQDLAINQGDGSVVVANTNAQVNITINKIIKEKVYIHSSAVKPKHQQLLLPQETIIHDEQSESSHVE